MEPASEWDAAGHTETIETLSSLASNLTIRVWGGDWCGDCEDVLPPFAAALQAAGIDPADVEQYPVEKADDGSKVGPGVTAYGIERIPTIIVERNDEEVARFVESEPVDAATYIAEQLSALELST